MANPKTTIELNGKLYDVRSGKVIQDFSSAVPTFKKQAPKYSVAPSKLENHRQSTLRPESSRTDINSYKPAKRREVTAVAAVRQLERSKTLMRPAVKKPAAPQPANNSSHTPLKPKTDHARMVRAQKAQKSQLIKKFHASNVTTSVSKKSAAMPVAKHNNHLSVKAAGLAANAQTQMSHSAHVVEAALHNASSHLMKLEKDLIDQKGLLERVGFRNKLANMASLTAAGLLLVGFFAYQNAPNIEMRLASSRAGVSAKLPGYSPAGFGVSNDIDSQPGKVSVTFRSRTDDRTFKVTQQASNWSSDSLLSNHVVASNQPYLTYPAEGKTVYIYNNSTATWVDKGIWYQVDGSASLTSDQLLRIANSL